LVKKLQEERPEARGQRSDSGGGDSGPKAKLALGGGVAVQAVHAVAALPQADGLPQPEDYRALVALFSDKREAGLHSQLYGQINLVRFEQGHLALRIPANAPPNLAGRIGQCLTEWTGQRWVVSISAEAGDITLAEQDKAIEAARHERARAHPLMQAVLTSFPDAKLISLKQRVVAPPSPSGEDEPISSDTESLTTEFED
jgi:DNA polymerase-3 subunit gamma/tau